MKQILIILLLALIVFFPLFYGYVPHLVSRLVQLTMGLALIISIVKLLGEGKLHIPDYKFAALLLMVSIYSFFLLFSTTFLVPLNGIVLVRVLTAIVFLYGFLIFIPLMQFSATVVMRVLQSFAVLGFIVSVSLIANNIHLLSTLFSGTFVSYRDVTDVLGNINRDGAVLLISIASTYIWARSNKKVLALPLLGFLAFGLLLTLSRSSYIAVAVFFLVFSFFDMQYTKHKIAYVLALLGSVSLFFVLGIHRLGVLQNFLRVDRVLSGRENIWGEAINLLQSNVLTGVGLGEWRQASGIDTSVHNAYLHVAVENGVLSAIIYSILLCFILYLSYGAIRIYANSSTRFLAIGMFSLGVGFPIVSFFESRTIGGSTFLELFWLGLFSFMVLIYVIGVRKHSSNSA